MSHCQISKPLWPCFEKSKAELPQGLKPEPWGRPFGTPEGVPFQSQAPKTHHEIASSYELHMLRPHILRRK